MSSNVSSRNGEFTISPIGARVLVQTQNEIAKEKKKIKVHRIPIEPKNQDLNYKSPKPRLTDMLKRDPSQKLEKIAKEQLLKSISSSSSNGNISNTFDNEELLGDSLISPKYIQIAQNNSSSNKSFVTMQKRRQIQDIERSITLNSQSSLIQSLKAKPFDRSRTRLPARNSKQASTQLQYQHQQGESSIDTIYEEQTNSLIAELESLSSFGRKKRKGKIKTFKQLQVETIEFPTSTVIQSPSNCVKCEVKIQPNRYSFQSKIRPNVLSPQPSINLPSVKGGSTLAELVGPELVRSTGLPPLKVINKVKKQTIIAPNNSVTKRWHRHHHNESIVPQRVQNLLTTSSSRNILPVEKAITVEKLSSAADRSLQRDASNSGSSDSYLDDTYESHFSNLSPIRLKKKYEENSVIKKINLSTPSKKEFKYAPRSKVQMTHTNTSMESTQSPERVVLSNELVHQSLSLPPLPIFRSQEVSEGGTQTGTQAIVSPIASDRPAQQISLQANRIKEIIERKFKKLKFFQVQVKNPVVSREVPTSSQVATSPTKSPKMNYFKDPALLPKVHMVPLNQDFLEMKKMQIQKEQAFKEQRANRQKEVVMSRYREVTLHDQGSIRSFSDKSHYSGIENY